MNEKYSYLRTVIKMMDVLQLDEHYLLNLVVRSPNSCLCRCCLSECRDGVSLFAKQPVLDGMFSVNPAKILMSCFGIIVTRHDRLPQILCQTCLTSAKSTFILRKQCEKAEKILRIRRTLAENDKIIKTSSQISTKIKQESIQNTSHNKIILHVDHNKEIAINRPPDSKNSVSCEFKRESSVLNDSSNLSKTPTELKSVRRQIIIKKESVDYEARQKQMKRSYSRNTNIYNESVSRCAMESQASGIKRDWSCRETIKSVNSKKMLSRGYKMLELALGRDMIVEERKPCVKSERFEKNYDQNRIKSYLRDVWRSRHKKYSPHKNRKSDSSPLSGVSLCSFELMTPPKHYFYQNITNVTNLGFTTPEKQIKKCVGEQSGL